jgi:uncharacterized protein (TIGR00269 family)
MRRGSRGVRCARCDRPAVIDQPYRGADACGPHFLESVDDRIRREFHRQLPKFARGTVAVALSGGKDSAVALHATQRYFGRRPTVRVVAVTVDEGIEGYRNRTIVAAERLASTLGVEHRVVRMSERLGTTTDRTARDHPEAIPCSYCGVWRRRLLNDAAREAGADALVLGFNLDDLAQTVLMNLVRGEMARLGRMAPHRSRHPGLVPRVAPLAEVPEREVFLYARLRELPFDHAECPYAARAARNVFREVLWRLEEEMPGTRQSLLRTRERILALLASDAEGDGPVPCARCGEPASGGLCRSCELLEQTRLPLLPAGAP